MSYIRGGFGAVRPYLHGPSTLPEFLTDVLGAVEIERHVFSEDSAHVEMRVGDAVLVVEAGTLPPEVAAWSCHTYVYVSDVDEAWKRALERGATPVAAPEDKPYGERQAGFRDSAGNTWWIATCED